MEFIDLEKGTLAIKVTGPVSASELDSIEERAKTHQKGGSMNLLLIIKTSEDFEQSKFFTRLRTAVKNEGTVKRMAVITDRSWIERYGEMLTYVNALETKTFDEGQEKEAKDWITGEKTDREEKPPVPDR